MSKNRYLKSATAARVALAVLLLGVALSAALAKHQAEQNARALDERFRTITDEMANRLLQRLHTYEYGLRGAAGTVLVAGHPQVGRERYNAYAATRDISREFPGARGMGIIRRIRPEDEQQFLAAARADGWPDFHIRELGPNPGERFVIQYIEPVAPNRAAVGLDIASEPRRREAAVAAKDAGKATLTAPITLVQAAGKKQRSFLLLLPIYVANRLLDTPEQRDAASVGWAYAPLVMDEVLADFKIGGAYSLELRDTQSRGDGAFFTSYAKEAPPATELERRIPIAIYGRQWEARVRATPAFAHSLPLPKPTTVFGFGLGSSILLGFLSFLFVHGRRRAAQLRAEQARRAAIVDSSQDAVIGETLDGIVFEWNRGAEKLFGYSAEQALGKASAALILPPDRVEEDAALRASVARGEQLPPFDTTRLTADGRLLDVSITVSSIGGDGGHMGFSKTIRDISDAKRAEQAVRSLNQSLEQQVADRTLLLESARRDLQNILDAIPSLVSYWDRDLRNRFANQAYRSWFGWDPESMPGRAALELLDGRHVGGEERVRAALRGEPQIFELCFESEAGSLRHAVAHLLPDTVNGEVRGFYAIVFDVTQQKEAQARLAGALRENEALLRTLHEYAIVSVTDRAGRIIEANEHFIRISGYEPS
ncbi:MAG TPA: CHASE domain-containing protein, partial [Polyangiaceae bacterium]|nr:CHASE domain-containing protein [Polyangiaceae bacterium]